MLLMTTSWLVSGRPRQFMVMWENSRCSTLFHFDVPGGKWQTVISSPVSTAKAASSAFHAWVRYPSKTASRARTRTPPLIWRLLCLSGSSLVLTDQAVDDLPTHDPGGHIYRLAGL